MRVLTRGRSDCWVIFIITCFDVGRFKFCGLTCVLILDRFDGHSHELEIYHEDDPGKHHEQRQKPEGESSVVEGGQHFIESARRQLHLIDLCHHVAIQGNVTAEIRNGLRERLTDTVHAGLDDHKIDDRQNHHDEKENQGRRHDSPRLWQERVRFSFPAFPAYHQHRCHDNSEAGLADGNVHSEVT